VPVILAVLFGYLTLHGLIGRSIWSPVGIGFLASAISAWLAPGRRIFFGLLGTVLLVVSIFVFSTLSQLRNGQGLPPFWEILISVLGISGFVGLPGLLAIAAIDAIDRARNSDDER
jgi:hypothetical protein